MRSFSLLALAAAALAPFVGAAPAPVDAVAAVGAAAGVAVRSVNTAVVARSPVELPAVGAVPVVGSVVKPVENQLQVRSVKGVVAILVELKVGIAVHIDALNCLTATNATTEVIVPILNEIIAVVGVAVGDLKALVGADISVILCSLDGTAQVTVAFIAGLLAEILCLIFGALGFVLGVVLNVKILIDALVAVAFGACICELISAVLALVDGLLGALIPLVLGLVGIILALGLNVVGELLTIC